MFSLNDLLKMSSSAAVNRDACIAKKFRVARAGGVARVQPQCEISLIFATQSGPLAAAFTA